MDIGKLLREMNDLKKSTRQYTFDDLSYIFKKVALHILSAIINTASLVHPFEPK